MSGVILKCDPHSSIFWKAPILNTSKVCYLMLQEKQKENGSVKINKDCIVHSRYKSIYSSLCAVMGSGRRSNAWWIAFNIKTPLLCETPRDPRWRLWSCDRKAVLLISGSTWNLILLNFTLRSADFPKLECPSSYIKSLIQPQKKQFWLSQLYILVAFLAILSK